MIKLMYYYNKLDVVTSAGATAPELPGWGASSLLGPPNLADHYASSLANYIASWSFIICVVICYDVLFQINKTSKMMQSPAIDTLERELQASKDFLQRY